MRLHRWLTRSGTPGIAQASTYATFGGKHDLYVQGHDVARSAAQSSPRSRPKAPMSGDGARLFGSLGEPTPRLGPTQAVQASGRTSGGCARRGVAERRP
jgi:hypothetical protein